MCSGRASTERGKNANQINELTMKYMHKFAHRVACQVSLYTAKATWGCCGLEVWWRDEPDRKSRFRVDFTSIWHPLSHVALTSLRSSKWLQAGLASTSTISMPITHDMAYYHSLLAKLSISPFYSNPRWPHLLSSQCLPCNFAVAFL